MVVQAVEFSTFTFDVTEGVDVDDAVIGSVGGAIISATLTRTKSKGNIHSYSLVVVHDDVGANALEYSVRQTTITNGSAFSADNVFRTNAGVAQAAAVIRHTGKGEDNTYDIIVVHLNA